MEAFGPKYILGLERTLSISRRQALDGTLHLHQWQVDVCRRNPSLHEWTFDPWRGYNSSQQAMSKPMLMSWCVKGKHPCYFVVVQRFKRPGGWRVIKEADLLERSDPRRPFVEPGQHGNGWSDLRIFSDPRGKHLRVIYYDAKPPNKYFQPWTDWLFYKSTIDSLHVGPASTWLETQSWSKRHAAITVPLSQKNWSPFVWNDTVYFIYSSIPKHRIAATVSRDFDEGGHIGGQAVELDVFTSLAPASFHWDWGDIRGGTPAELIETPETGVKYLTFFHSQARAHHPAIKTYFMGAYLFEPFPPFRISHISAEPLVPSGGFYNESAFGWAYGNLDYVVFPMGLVVLDANSTVVVSVGLNDAKCFLLELGLRALVRTMVKL